MPKHEPGERGARRSPADRHLRRRPRQARARAKVGRILDAAFELLTREGLGAVTTTRVAEVADVPIGSIYTYFADREALLLALGAEIFEREDAAIIEALRRALENDDWREATRAAFNAVPRIVGDNPGRRQLFDALELVPGWREIRRRSEERIAEALLGHPAFARLGRSTAERRRIARVLVALAMAAYRLAVAAPSAREARLLRREGEHALMAYLAARLGPMGEGGEKNRTRRKRDSGPRSVHPGRGREDE